MTESVPKALDGFTGEERNKVYRMLRLKVTPEPVRYSVSGALRARLQNGTDELAAVLGQAPLRIRCKFGGRVETPSLKFSEKVL